MFELFIFSLIVGVVLQTLGFILPAIFVFSLPLHAVAFKAIGFVTFDAVTSHFVHHPIDTIASILLALVINMVITLILVTFFSPSTYYSRH